MKNIGKLTLVSLVLVMSTFMFLEASPSSNSPSVGWWKNNVDEWPAGVVTVGEMTFTLPAESEDLMWYFAIGKGSWPGRCQGCHYEGHEFDEITQARAILGSKIVIAQLCMLSGLEVPGLEELIAKANTAYNEGDRTEMLDYATRIIAALTSK